MSVREVLEALRCLWDIENMPTIIVVSGGEPMMQQAELLPLLRILTSYGHEVHIETAGTIAPTKEFNSVVTQYNCSPKLLHSGNVLSKRFKPIVIKAINDTNKAWFKFVVSDDIDVCFEEIAHIATTCDLPYDRIMVMPEGSTPSENIALAQKIVDRALVRGWGLSFRTHVLLWGDDKDK
jgi:organic radical activating enzyme